MARFPKIAPENFSEAQKSAAAAITGGPRGAGALGGPFLPLLYSPELMERAQAVGEYLRFQSPLPDRLKEMAIVITARAWSAQFEWWAHRSLALAAGVAEETLEAIAQGVRP